MRPSQEECKKVVRGVFAKKSFQEAIEALQEDRDAYREAKRDLRAFLKQYRVRVPRGVEVGLCGGAVSRMRTICVSWCTVNACYIYCAVLQH